MQAELEESTGPGCEALQARMKSLDFIPCAWKAFWRVSCLAWVRVLKDHLLLCGRFIMWGRTDLGGWCR